MHIKQGRNGFNSQLVTLLPRLRRFAYALTAGGPDADDLVQAACERALSRKNQWRKGSRLDSWMFKIMSRLRIDTYRSKEFKLVRQLQNEAAIPDNGLTPEEETDAKTRLEQVMLAMDRLSKQDRAMLALVCLEGYSYRETARMLDIPIGTVMSRLARARKKLVTMVDGPSRKKTE